MGTRSGPFWEAAQGRAPLPRAAATLGFELQDADPDAGTIEVAFTATEDFTNPGGVAGRRGRDGGDHGDGHGAGHQAERSGRRRVIADARATYAAGVVPVNSRNSRMKCAWSARPVPGHRAGHRPGRARR